MDRSLDDIVSDRQQRGPPRRGGGRYDDRARDPPRKPRDAPNDIDRDWVHDRYEVDDYARPNRREARPQPPASRGARPDRYDNDVDRSSESSAKLRVDNVHYELYENDLKELFERIGPVTTVQILYDRSDRSKGIAYVTYTSHHDAQRALREYNGANAYGQPISLTLMPTGPSGGRGGTTGGAGRSLDDRISAPERSLFDRIEGGSRGGGGVSRGDRDEGGRSSRSRRSESPRNRERTGMRRSDVTRSAPEGIDRYIPGDRDDRRRDRERSRSPMRRGGDRRGRGGRRGGEDRRGGDRDRERAPRSENAEGRGTRGGRPRKTADELDAEMEDYWGGSAAAAAGGDAVQGNEVAGGAASGAAGIDAEPIGGGGAASRDDLDDVDMIE